MRPRGISIIKKIFASKVFLAASLIVLVAASLALARVITRKLEINQEIANLENKIQNLENQNLELTDLINYLQTEEFEEEVARLQLGLKKPGEKVVVISPAATGSIEFVQEPGTEDTSADGDPDKIPNPIKWWRYFFVSDSIVK